MRRGLIRSTVTAVVLAVVIIGVPMAALVGLHLSRDAGVHVDNGSGLSVRAQTMVAFAVIAVFAVVAVLAGVLLAAKQSRRFSEPMRELAERAERLGAGESRFQPLVSGVQEVDRVAQVLERSAHQLNSSLAAEREFASDASHQLRTPLTALLMRLEEISLTDDLDVAREEARIAIDQVERLTRVVDELLTRNRRGGDTAGVSVSLDSVIAALQREWQPAFEQARRSVYVHGERGLRVQATPVALSQMLSTLLENSLDHGRGTVDLHARRSGPSVVVEVSDQGPGVPADIAPHIFERSVSSASSTGLGLALARDLAEANGGRLELVQAQPVIFALFLSEAGL
ncbi:MAG TPA: HAMP domain-containing sensor histidine kinase [Segeticoccus sp.]|uniref:sensor histidine kinase n=1 Tax=Segeticoccus sp. TaxID=2706531 RepID=UPI002D7E9AEA|nr:HAMP domain-containing sensor histidine kinase [Segeticoccus sp.]HET8599669.1 HAMP domain-containing sensor histidine kinase [Segeticoccus sp.]